MSFKVIEWLVVVFFAFIAGAVVGAVQAEPYEALLRQGVKQDVGLIRPPTFKGTIGSIGVKSLRLNGEGGRMTFAIDGQTQFLVNDQPASLTDLRPGDRAMAEYAMDGGVVLLLIVER